MYICSYHYLTEKHDVQTFPFATVRFTSEERYDPSEHGQLHDHQGYAYTDADREAEEEARVVVNLQLETVVCYPLIQTLLLVKMHVDKVLNVHFPVVLHDFVREGNL